MSTTAANRLGVWLALTAEAMFFLGLFGVVLVLRSNNAAAAPVPPLPGGYLLLLCAVVAAIASGPLSLGERAGVRVIGVSQGDLPDRNPPHPSALPGGEGTQRVLWALVVVSGLLSLVQSWAAWRWPADPSPLPAAAAVISGILMLHVGISLVATLRPLFKYQPSSVGLLWYFAAGVWIARRLLI